MGSGQSSISKQTNEILNQTLTTMVTNTTNSTNVVNVNANSFNVKIENMYPGCPLKISQKINADQAVKVNIAIKNVTDLRNQIKTAAKNKIEQLNESKIGFLATSLSVQSNISSVSTKVNNLVDTKITSNTVNAISALLDNANKGILEVTNCHADIVIDQSIISKQVANIIANSLVTGTQSTDNITDIANDTTQSNKSTQAGISELVDSIGNIFSGALIVVVLVMAGFGFVVYKGNAKMIKIASNPYVLACIALVVIVMVSIMMFK